MVLSCGLDAIDYAECLRRSKKDNLEIFNHLLRIYKIKIRLMADYFCYPLWHDDGINMGDIGPASLPISNELKETK